MKSRVSVSIWFGTSLKFVRSRLPASVSVAIQPVSLDSLMTKGDNSTVSVVTVRVAAGIALGGGGRVCASEANGKTTTTRTCARCIRPISPSPGTAC